MNIPTYLYYFTHRATPPIVMSCPTSIKLGLLIPLYSAISSYIPASPKYVAAILASVSPFLTMIVVKKGDTLASIAATYLGDAGMYELIAEYNGISNPNLIEVGQLIT